MPGLKAFYKEYPLILKNIWRRKVDKRMTVSKWKRIELAVIFLPSIPALTILAKPDSGIDTLTLD
ncbi:hypothetical protein CEE39_02715 [bacterium (candidate division B38) B3_B38]|nr:MAG: hypothetical protein CEE39_02715 [bacterium (candidate division B38) B3_B38]